jgi:hypothetical protein
VRAESRPSAYFFSRRSDLEDIGCTFFVLIMMPPSSLMWLGQKGNHGIAGSGEARGMDLPLEENVVDSGPLFDFRLNSRASLTHKHRIPPLIFINC